MSSILYMLILSTLLASQVTSVKPRFAYECHENGRGKFAANSTYKANLNQALSNLLDQSSQQHNTKTSGFYNYSYGLKPDKVHAIGLCRGDVVGTDICHQCLEKSSQHLIKACPDEREATGGYDECVLRYSNRSPGLMETHPRAYMWNNQSVPSNYSDVFVRKLMTLLNDLRNRTSMRIGPLGKYSSANISTGLLGFESIYGVAQCIPDLSPMECNKCLDKVFVDVPRFGGVLGWRVITPSCNFRFEVYLFYGQPHNSTPPLLTNNTSTSQGFSRNNNDNNTSYVVGTGGLVASAASVALIISIGVYTRMKKTNSKAESDASTEVEEEIIGCVGYLKFDYNTIKATTKNFSDQKKIGQSTVGVVYKGKLRSGQEIAVKCVNSQSHRVDFRNEVLRGAQIFHRNIVRLFGFCSKGDTSYLVFEYFPRNLHRVLFDLHIYRRENLNWENRYKIINGIARALLYLHEDSGMKFAHGDIKSSKILLDENLNPKISCFGNSQKSETDIRGDVFSFGVLILEIVTRQQSECHTESLISYVQRNWNRGVALNFVDLELRDSNRHFDTITRCVHIALLCVQIEADLRPTMSSVFLMLNSNSLTLPIIPESEFSLSIPILLDPKDNDDIESSESLSSCNSFVSATENLSPISETNSHEDESSQVNCDVSNSRGLYLKRISSLWHNFFRD